MFESEQNWREKRHLQMTEREIADVTDNCPNHISNEKRDSFALIIKPLTGSVETAKLIRTSLSTKFYLLSYPIQTLLLTFKRLTLFFSAETSEIQVHLITEQNVK